MKISTPQEIEAFHIIPAIRREIAVNLKRKGFSQRDIAKKLELTEAAVSYYIKGKRGNEVKFDALTFKQIDKAARNLVEGSKFVKEITCLCNFLRNTKKLCKIEYELGYAPCNCKVCYK